MIKEFSLERVGKAGAVFNIDKLNWINQQHIKLKSDAELLELVRSIVQEKRGTDVSDEYIVQVIHLMKERVVVLNDFVDACPYLYEDPSVYDESAKAKNWKTETPDHVALMIKKIELLESFDASSVELALRATAEELKIGAGKLIHPLRLAISGVANGPSLFHMMETLGKDVILRRITAAIESLK